MVIVRRPSESAIMGGVIARFFVYGTLRLGGAAHHRFLSGYVVSNEPAVLMDHALYGRTFRYPFIVAEQGFRVVGDLVTVPGVAVAELLGILDDYEGDEYVRTTVAVEPDGETSIEAWTYVAIPDLEFPPDERIPSGDWLSR